MVFTGVVTPLLSTNMSVCDGQHQGKNTSLPNTSWDWTPDAVTPTAFVSVQKEMPVLTRFFERTMEKVYFQWKKRGRDVGYGSERHDECGPARDEGCRCRRSWQEQQQQKSRGVQVHSSRAAELEAPRARKRNLSAKNSIKHDINEELHVFAREGELVQRPLTEVFFFFARRGRGSLFYYN